MLDHSEYVDPFIQDGSPDLKGKIVSELFIFSFILYMFLIFILVILTGDLPSLANCVGLFLNIIALCSTGVRLIQRIITMVVFEIIVNFDLIQTTYHDSVMHKMVRSKKGIENEP